MGYIHISMIIHTNNRCELNHTTLHEHNASYQHTLIRILKVTTNLTLFDFIILLCGTDNIMQNILHI